MSEAARTDDKWALRVPDKCPRCGADLHPAYTMSFFVPLYICMDCAKDEEGAPNFERARAIERREIEQGNRNFPGIGLAREDRAYLERRREERRKKAKIPATCQRCGGEMDGGRSMFDDKWLCSACVDDECELSRYDRAALAAEHHEWIGLSEEDEAELKRRRMPRQPQRKEMAA